MTEAARPPRRRFFVIHNVAAGRGRRRLLTQVIARLVREGAIVTSQIVEDIETDKRLAREAAASGDYDAIVAAGGDGTVRGGAAGLIGSTLPLGIIPVGTGNVMAAELGLPAKAGSVARTLMTGVAKPVLGGRANGEPFFLMAGAGFDAEVVRALPLTLKRNFGKLAYAGPVLAALARPLPRLRVDVDGTRHDASWVVVTNVRRYGGAFVLSPGSSIAKPGLATILFQPASRPALVRQLLTLCSGRLAKDPAIKAIASERTTIEADDPVAVHIDGDGWSTTPVTIEPERNPFYLIVPPDNDAR